MPVLDHPEKTRRLLARLEDAVPLEAMLSAGLAQSHQEQRPWMTPMMRCTIKDIHYLGTFGGIACALDFGRPEETELFIVSITHLRFDPRQPLAREIAAYQKHRVKRIRQQDRRGAVISNGGTDIRLIDDVR